MKRTLIIIAIIILCASSAGFLIVNASTNDTISITQRILSGLEIDPSAVTYRSEPDNISPEVVDIRVKDIGSGQMSMRWESTEMAKCTASWRKNVAMADANYIDGVFSENLYNIAHSIILERLWPDSLYFASIWCTDAVGNRSEEWTTEFMTPSSPDRTSPPEVTNLSGTVRDGTIVLEWANPDVDDFAGVIIERAHTAEISYIGSGYQISECCSINNTFIDRDIEMGFVYHYLVSTQDISGNRSRGVPISIRYFGQDDNSVIVKETIITKEIDKTIIAPSPEDSVGIEGIEIWQNGVGFSFIQDTIVVKGNRAFAMTIPESVAPEGTVRVALVLVDKIVHSFVFNKDEKLGVYKIIIPSKALYDDHFIVMLRFIGSDGSIIETVVKDLWVENTNIITKPVLATLKDRIIFSISVSVMTVVPIWLIVRGVYFFFRKRKKIII